MFGFSFGELLVICVVALVAVGPQKLPRMLRTLGQWMRKLRNLTYEMRTQSGIDDILRAEGLHGGLNELRGLMRGPHTHPFIPPVVSPPVPAPAPIHDPYEGLEIDPTKEYPPEGPDAYGALPDDLVDEGALEEASRAEGTALEPGSVETESQSVAGELPTRASSISSST